MNKLKKTLVLAISLCVALALTACLNSDGETETETGAVDQEGVIATVNDKSITQDKFDESVAVYKKMVEAQYGEGAWDTEISEGKTMGSYYEDGALLDNMILEVVIVDAAEKEGITMTDEELQKQLDDYKLYFETDEEYQQFLTDNGMSEEYMKDALKKEYIINEFIAAKIENLEPTEEELETLFNDLKLNEKVKASHILVATEEEAKAVKERLDNGENFEDLAKELSIDTASGANGGDLDYFSYTDMVQPFSDAAFSLEIGEISEPVESDFGYHIIETTDKTVDDTITLESTKDELTNYYKNYKYEDLLTQLKDDATIVIK